MINKNEEISSLLKEGEKAYKSQQYIHSLELFKKALDKDPDNVEISYHMGILLVKMGEYRQAVDYFDKILDSSYQFIYHVHILNLKAYALSQLNEFKSAKAVLEEVLRYNGNDIKALSILSYIHYKAKEYDVALRIYNRILKIDGNHFNTINSKGFLLIYTEKNIDKGLELCKKAYQLNPNSPAVLDSLGWGYYKKGDLDKSLTYIKRAFELLPDNREIKMHMLKIVKESNKQ